MGWNELRLEFEALNQGLIYSRLDFQWGSSGTYYRLAGSSNSIAKRKFETLAVIAGNKLNCIAEEFLSENVQKAPDAASKWYEIVREISGSFEFGFVAGEINDEGIKIGNIYTGSIRQPAESCALTCLKLHQLPVKELVEVNTVTIFVRVNGYIKHQAENHGYIWSLVAFFVFALLAILAL